MQNPIRIVVAGMGNRAIWAIPALRGLPQFRLVALLDSVPQRMEEIAKEYQLGGDIHRYTNLSDCLSRETFDALAVLTPDGTHADLLLPALEAGKFVFVEKPLDIDERRLDAIIRADNAVGGRTFVGFNLRYAPVYVKVRELIQAGVLGRVMTIQADEFYDGGRTYFRRWNRLEKFGGGLWITKACHDFDLLYWMAGAQPVSVHASSSLDYYVPRADAAMYCRDCRLAADCPDRLDRYIRAGTIGQRLLAVTEQATGAKADLCLYNSDKDTFDHGVATVTFSNHIIATYTVNVVAGFSTRRMRVAGTKAAVDASSDSGRVTVRYRDPSRVEEIDVPTSGMHAGADDHILPAFAEFVRGHPTRFVAPSEAAVSVRLGLAARRSSRDDQVVHMGSSTI